MITFFLLDRFSKSTAFEFCDVISSPIKFTIFKEIVCSEIVHFILTFMKIIIYQKSEFGAIWIKFLQIAALRIFHGRGKFHDFQRCESVELGNIVNF